MTKVIPKIIITGSISIDRIMNFKGAYRDLIKPDKLHVLSLSVFLEELKDSHGGVGANIAYSLALLGERPVLLGSVGRDARRYMKALARQGVETSFVHYSRLPTAAFNVITDLDDNQIGGFFPGAMFDSRPLTLRPWENEPVFVVISPHDPTAMKRQVAEVKRYGLPLLYDFGQQVSNAPAADLRAGVAAAEVLVGNDYEMAVLAEKIGWPVGKICRTVPVCVTTLGKDGSLIEGQKVRGTIKITAVKPKAVVDPTGAGDAYRAGFLYGYVRGWELETCGQLGALVSSYAVAKQGTQKHSFTRQEFKVKFKSCFGKSISL